MRILRLVWLVPATVALIAAAALVPRLSDDEPAPGEAHVEVEGLARVTRADGGPVERVREDTELRRGDRLAMVEGRAELELSAGVDYEARAAADPKASTALTMGTVPVLHAGELLVTAEDDASLEAAGTRVELESTGGPAALRLSRSLAVGVEVYDGVADVDSAGKRGLVPAFRQLEVPAFGEVPQRAEPLAFTHDDDWDRRFLRPAIALDERLDGFLTSFDSSVELASSPVSFLRSVLPTSPDTSVLEPLVEPRTDNGDTLVGATITDLSSEGSSFASTWTKVFDFHDEGATWGLVALDRAVANEQLTAVVDDAVQSDDVELASGATPAGADDDPVRPAPLTIDRPDSTALTPPLLPPLETTTTTEPPSTGGSSSTTTGSTAIITTDTRCCPTTESTTTTTTTTTTEPPPTPPTEPRTTDTSSTTTTTSTTLPPSTAAVPVSGGPAPASAQEGATAAVAGASAGD